MAETYTPPQSEKESTSEDPFTAVQEIQEASAAAAAQRLIEHPKAAPALPAETGQDRTPSPRVQRNRRIARNIVGGVVSTGVAATLVAGAAGALAPAEFSEETTTWTAESGDGLYDAAEEIAGINTVDIRDGVDFIQTHPANIDALKDGLQAGEQIVIPVSVEGHEEK